MYTNTDYLKAIASNIVWPAPRKAGVAMFHIGRSGSTVLGNLFNQNPKMFWDSEIFMTNRMPEVWPSQVKNLLLRDPDLTIRSRRMRTRRPVYGYEAKLSQAQRGWGSLDNCVAQMEELSFDHAIILRRRNHLRVIISDLVSRDGGPWHVAKEPSAPKQVYINIDAIDLGSLSSEETRPLVDHINQTEAEFTRLENLLEGKSVLKLYYENHIKDDPRVAYRLACEFLGIEPTEVSIKYRKTNPFGIEKMITNFDDVSQALKDTPYEWMLHE